MKLSWIAILGCGLLVCQASAQEPDGLKAAKDKQSYAIGVQMARTLKLQGLEVEPSVLVMGIKDELSGGKILITDEDLRNILLALQDEMKQKQSKAQSAAAEDNKKAGESFLAENAKKDGVVTLPSGLEYKILRSGGGKKPAETDTVLCNYRGTFIDGKEFDSSTQSGKPVPFEIKAVIPGFKEALQLMPVGSKWQIFVPSNLAYGERGAGGVIGPNTALVFEIELVSIQDKP